MGRKRKIAFHLNCLEQGGAERVVSNLANQFAKEGYEVLVATEWFGENEFLIDQCVRRVHVGLKDGDEKKNRILQFLLRVKYLRQFMKKEKPDILIAFAQRANYRALMAAPGTDVPVLISIRTDPVGHYDAWSDKLQIPLLFPRAAGCVFQTEGQREFFAPYLQKNSRVILNPLHDKYIGVPKPEHRRKEVVQSGRLVDFKNQPMLLRAFVEVHRKHPDYVLRIYGGDSFDGTKEILEGIIAENRAQDYIRLMAADCPCGGPRTVMEDGVNGLLIPVKDQKALEEGINKLIEQPDYAEKLGAEARKIAGRANAKAVFGQWRDYIDVICGS